MSDDVAKRAWVQRVLGVGSGDGSPSPDAPVVGLVAWKAARSAAIGQLKRLEGAIAAMKHPRGTQAIILVKAIQANLTASPDSARSVGELKRYLQTDDIIAEAEQPNGFGIKVELRKPLLDALSTLERQLAG